MATTTDLVLGVNSEDLEKAEATIDRLIEKAGKLTKQLMVVRDLQKQIGDTTITGARWDEGSLD